MKDQEKLAMLEEIFEMDEGKLKATDQLEKLENWDSMAVLSLIVLVSDNFNKRLTGEVIESFVTVQDLLNIME